MGLPSTIGSLAFSDSKSEIVAEYQRLRPTRLRLNNSLVAKLSRATLEEGAQKLGMLRDGTFVFDSEDETAVLMDYCIYEMFRNGSNAVEQYLLASPPMPGSDEDTCLRAMQAATYGLVVVMEVQRGMGCLIQDLFTGKQHLLVDMGLSKSAKPGSLIAGRLLDFGKYYTTGGASLPLGVLTEEQLNIWREKFRAGCVDENADHAPLIRESLRCGAMSRIHYAGLNDEFTSNVESTVIRCEDPAARKRALQNYVAAKPASNVRCRCGSGKMYKNCCMKRQN